MKRILVGIDGTAPAIASLGWAAVLAERTGAEIILANVLDPDQAEFSSRPPTHSRSTSKVTS